MVDCDLVAHDEFIRSKDISCTNADSIVAELKDVLLRMNLKLNKCRGPCYDGCSAMTGHRNRVVVQIKEEQKRALYTHCYSHSLNLAIGDNMKNSALLKHTIDNTFELTKLVKKSPKKDSKLKEIQNSLAIADDRDNEDYELNKAKPSISMFCPTRWTVRGKYLMAIIESFDELQRLWEWAIENTSDTSMKARIRGISSYSKTFSYCFGIHLATTILNNSDNLYKTLQATQLSSIDVQRITRNTVSTLESIGSDQNFNLFYEKVEKFAHDHDVDEPSLPGKRKPRMTIENYFNTAESDQPETLEDEYRRKYFEAIDLVVSCIKNRFDQDDFEMCALCEQLLVKAANKESFTTEFEKITNFYADDFKPNALETQLKTLLFTLPLGASNAETFRDVLRQVKGLSKGQKLQIGEVVKL